MMGIHVYVNIFTSTSTVKILPHTGRNTNNNNNPASNPYKKSIHIPIGEGRGGNRGGIMIREGNHEERGGNHEEKGKYEKVCEDRLYEDKMYQDREDISNEKVCQLTTSILLTHQHSQLAQPP